MMSGIPMSGAEGRGRRSRGQLPPAGGLEATGGQGLQRRQGRGQARASGRRPAEAVDMAGSLPARRGALLGDAEGLDRRRTHGLPRCESLRFVVGEIRSIAATVMQLKILGCGSRITDVPDL
jgi:hypothetical protein